jgi:two-component system, NtrC family, response regulator AtoC
MLDETHTILIVDDDAALRRVLVALLEQHGLATVQAGTAERALELLDHEPIDVVLTDLRMPGSGGMQLVSDIQRRWPELPVIVLTAHGSVPLAVEAMQRGAADFMLKPFERDEVVYVVSKALLAARSAHPPPVPGDKDLLGNSRGMAEVRDLLRRAASSSATVLIRGETGTGKELVARAIHEHSPRKSGPFVKLHCAALPDSLLESELFGHEKGAFTGAAARKPGRVELAESGSLFLDEIGDVPLATQVKLLRVLQEREFERVGGVHTLKVNVRFIAATHRNLEQMVQSGQFRQDLFYRLNVVPLEVPPLRERRDDIELLARRFAAQSAAQNGKGAHELEPAALERLSQEPWPGNVRQLENFVERLVVLGDEARITLAAVERELAREAARQSPLPPAASVSAQPLGDQRRELEKAAVLAALSRSGNNRAQAARLLGVSRRTLYNKLGELGIA